MFFLGVGNLFSLNIFEIIFFDYFCNYYNNKGLGKKLYLFNILVIKKKIISIYNRNGNFIFYFKN